MPEPKLVRGDGALARAFLAGAPSESETAMIEAGTIASAGYIVCAVEDAGVPVGLAGLRLSSRAPALFVAVRDDLQGRGLGRALTEDVMRASFRKYGYLTLSTYERPEYAAAIAMYRRLGFRHLARRGDKIWMIASDGVKGRIAGLLVRVVYPLILSRRDRRRVGQA